MLIIIYWSETYWLQKSNESLLVATEKIGRELNGEKPAPILISCDANIEEYHNIKESTTSPFVGITEKKSKVMHK